MSATDGTATTSYWFGMCLEARKDVNRLQIENRELKETVESQRATVHGYTRELARLFNENDSLKRDLNIDVKDIPSPADQLMRDDIAALRLQMTTLSRVLQETRISIDAIGMRVLKMESES